MPPDTPIIHASAASPTLRELISPRLRDHTIWERISAGAVISVRTVAGQWHVSLPVQEALRYLRADALVNVPPRGATRVKRIPLEQVREICERRNLLDRRLRGGLCPASRRRTSGNGADGESVGAAEDIACRDGSDGLPM